MTDKGAKGWIFSQGTCAIWALTVRAHACPGIAPISITLGHGAIMSHCSCPIGVVHCLYVLPSWHRMRKRRL